MRVRSARGFSDGLFERPSPRRHARSSRRAPLSPGDFHERRVVPRRTGGSERIEEKEEKAREERKKSDIAGVMGLIMREPPATNETSRRPCSPQRVMRNNFELMSYSRLTNAREQAVRLPARVHANACRDHGGGCCSRPGANADTTYALCIN